MQIFNSILVVLGLVFQNVNETCVSYGKLILSQI